MVNLEDDKMLPNPGSRLVEPWTRWSLARRQRVIKSRRSFLRAVGASATALPCLQLLGFGMLEESAVWAQAGIASLRFVGVYHPHGAASPLFRRRPDDTETQFDISFTEPSSGAVCVLQPFDDPVTYGTSFKDKLLILDGLDFKTGLNGHDAPKSIFTASGQNDKLPSLDQFLAVDQGLGSDTPFTSLVLGVGSVGEGNDFLSYSSAGAPLPRMIDPSETFDAVFAQFAAGGDPAKAAEAEKRRRHGQSVLDYLRYDIDRLRSRLAPTEAQKLEQHLTSLREIEKQLAGFEGSCMPPAEPQSFEKLKRYNGGEPNFEAITNLQVDMLAQAMGCGLTRYATLWLADLSSGAIASTGIDHSEYSEGVDVHNSIAHQYVPPRGSHFGNGASEGDPQSWERIGIQNRYSYGKCARLLSGLQSSGALDDTLVMISTDMGDPSAHSSRDVPMVLAGGAGGKLAMGRHVQLKANCPPDRYHCKEELNLIAHNHLLVSLANLFGVETDSFGHAETPEDTSGGLPELG